MRITGGLRITGSGIRLGSNLSLPVMRWDPTYITGGIPMVSDFNNTVVFDTGPGNYTAIATTSIPLTGAYMFTVSMDFNIDAMVPDIGGYVGFGNRNFNNQSNIGSDANSIGFSDTGLAFFQNAVIATGLPTFNTNTTRIIDVAVLNNSYIWIRVDGGDWNNNASSNLLDGTGGLSDLGTAGFTELYPMVTVAGDMGPTEFKILPTSPYGIPSGVTFLNMYTPPSLFVPTVAPGNLFVGEAVYEMGQWNPFVDPSGVPDISGYGHDLALNDNAAGNANWYHFYNNSAQANDTGWPPEDIGQMTFMGWFAFADFNQNNVSLVTRTNGGYGWALRVDGNGTQINLVKYSDSDQKITLGMPLTTNQWHFIAVSQDGANLIFNIDGTSYSTTGSATNFGSDNGAPVRLQYDSYTGGNQNTEMWMRDVKIIPFAYDANTLMYYYASQKTGYGY